MKIIITGFKNKKQMIKWLEQYEGGIEQHFDCKVSTCEMASFTKEMNEFESDNNKTDFNLLLK